MPHSVAALALASLCVIAASSAAVAKESGTNKINGSIEIATGETAGDLRTVNGTIRLRDNAVAEDVTTVNGNVTLGLNSRVKSASTVNGGIELRAGAKVAGDVSNVNGDLTIERTAEVGEAVTNVNGRIRIEGAIVRGQVRTVNADIDIDAGSRIEGGILVEEPRGWNYKQYSRRRPRIVIGPNAVVNGTLVFEREVELYVSTSAKVGAVKGATVKSFSGDRP